RDPPGVLCVARGKGRGEAPQVRDRPAIGRGFRQPASRGLPMPTYVNPDKCDGCKALDRPACQYICPNDLMTLDKSLGESWNQEPDLCWECYACVKTCPQGAIAMRGYGDVVPLGASLTPLRGTDAIMWTVKFRDGQMKRFKFPIRTTPWG